MTKKQKEFIDILLNEKLESILNKEIKDNRDLYQLSMLKDLVKLSTPNRPY